MDSRLSRWCEGFIEAGWLVAVIAVPLFFNVYSARVFEPDKLALLRSIALLMAIAWLVKFIDGRGWQRLGWLRWKDADSIWRRPFVLPVFLLVIVYLVSTLFSVAPRISWAGSYQRLQGTYTTLSYIVIFALMAATMRTRAQVERVVTAVIVTSIPVSLYGVLQHAGVDPLPWGGDVQERVAGHMGNAIFIAAYLIMALLLTVARMIDAFTGIMNEAVVPYTDYIRAFIYYVFCFLAQIMAIYWSGSRGPWLGLGVGLFVFALILLVALRNMETKGGRIRLVEGVRAFVVVAVAVLLPLYLASGPLRSTGPVNSLVIFAAGTAVLAAAILIADAIRRGWRWVWLDWISLAVLLGALLVLFNAPPAATEPYQDTPVAGNVLTTLSSWRDIRGVGRLGRLLEDNQDTGKVRVLIWQGVLELIRPHEPIEFPGGRPDKFNFLRPLIGYGPESMYLVYNRFFPPELGTVEARGALPDRSHNETFDALVITGVAGFLAWQILYVSVFYYAFRWLGVVRTRRDRNLLIGLWVAGAVVVGLAFSWWRGPVYLGVAIPFGSILGLVLYLIYYALLAEPGEEAAKVHPFQMERLLMMALVGAVAAHYVEIHFGIAIAATRLHFFVYLALLFVIGHWQPYAQEAAVAVEENQASRQRKGLRQAPAAAQSGWLSSALVYGLMMALLVGILGYEFMRYTAPPGRQILQLADVPSAGEIFHQSLFVHSDRGFVDSPFVFLMIAAAWALGTLATLSEMAKQGLVSFGPVSGKLAAGRPRLAAGVFGLMVVVGLILRAFLPQPEGVSTTRLIGLALFWLWILAAGVAALLLLAGHRAARRTAGIIGLIGLLAAIPAMVAGGYASLFGLILGLGSLAALYLLWDKGWTPVFGPAAVIGLLSAAIGFFYAYFQAFQVRTAIIISGLQGVDEVERRVLEADYQTGYLTVSYLFVAGLLVILALALSQWRASREHQAAPAVATISLVALVIVGLYVVYQTNLRVIHADMVYDRGAAFEGRWDYAAAIYERAVELAPLEDTYYLWLGRAYLENSSVTADPASRASLLETAREKLERARVISPLNADHTTNLARLHTRWAALSTDGEREENIQTAISYYEAALNLSPHNAVIWNEYAQLVHSLQGECDRAIELYDRSAEIDPFYSNTYFDRSKIYLACAEQAAGEEQQAYYAGAIASLEEGLARQPGDPRFWLEKGQVYQQLENFEEALAAYEEARERANAQVPPWNVDYLMATLFLDMGDLDRARLLGQEALAAAPPEQQAEIQALLNEVEAGGSTP
ncbi:MAG: tetratricopeptide repeat protein [Chloroflexi bacterium]|nr:tetratricopeptide repeat protein [Chloroflexota bacterium]MCI0574650.1 tetratricopeptide repeat protein [Chloroflexota bacterium]MCI0649068.1 tetratricopeptide repeat protein [Chloroflexota bacterium]MCI0730523.1 tetratricopeptide repeat protein [Chloroflexota bacterium]